MTTPRRTACLTAAALAATVLVVPGAATAAPVTSTGSTSASPAAPGTSASRAPAAGQPLVRRLIVRMAGGGAITPAVTAAATGLSRVSSAKIVRRLGTGATLVSLSSPLDLDRAWQVARELAARSDVVSAQPDLLMHRLATASPVPVNDPRAGQQWDLWDSAAGSPGGFASKAPSAWSRTRGKASVVVAVLDTGITAHPDLPSSSFVAGYDFVGGDVVGATTHFYTANDGNGRDPNPSDPGDWISAAEASGSAAGGFFADNNCAQDTSSWHGTHVTGTIVAAQDNHVGISGMAPGVKVEPLRVLGKCGGYTSDISDAIVWASGGAVAGVPANTNKAAVISLSLGGPGACDAETQAAITAARAAGSTVVVAAGNSGESIVPTVADPTGTGSNPANCSGVVDVVATGRDGHLASYSNFGVVAGSTVIAAQGGAGFGDTDDILSTVNAGATNPVATPGGAYANYAGTSMATPHVAAAIALLQSVRPGTSLYTPDQVVPLITGLTRAFPSGSGCTIGTCGAGILDLSKALPTFAPDPPTDLVTQPGPNYITLSWTAPTYSGGLPLGYDIEQSTDGTSFFAPVSAVGTITRINGLTAGTDYWFRVRAANTAGSSAWVVIGPVQPAPLTKPQSPLAPTLVGGVEHLAITWEKPDDGGSPLTGYSVELRRQGAATWSCVADPAKSYPDCAGLVAADATSASAGWPAALAAGTYEVRVAAQNSLGLGLYSPTSTAVVTPLTQSLTLSATTVRPYRDGFQDAVTIRARSNVPSGGTLRVLTRTNTVVRAVTLRSGQRWSYAWNGRDSRGRRVANGTYRVQVLLRGRTATEVALPARAVTVASSQATTPVITLSSGTVFPYPDGYLDTISISARATVPATWTWRLVGARGRVWSPVFGRRVIAHVHWAGRGNHNVALPAGTYTLFATATGGEGRAVTGQRTVRVSAKRVRPVRFSASFAANKAVDYGFDGAEKPSVDGTVVRLPEGAAATFTWRLPASVLPTAGVRVSVVSDGGVAGTRSAVPRAGWFSGSSAKPVPGVSWALVAGRTPGPVSAGPPSLAGGTLRWLVHNADPSVAGSSEWLVRSFTVTGTRYLLRPART